MSRIRGALRRLVAGPPPPPAPPRPPPSPDEVIRAYHARTRHHPARYAASLGYLDWASQPDPFRRWEGAPVLALPLVPPGPAPRYEAACRVGGVPPRPVDLDSVAQLCMDALALSAWKRAGSAEWSLRVDPSSGNLHPTEAYLLTPAAPGLPAGLWHYQPWLHALERRGALPDATLPPPGGLLVALTSIWWRESWKYGERAWRYCQLDLGHVLGTLAFAAAGLGWEARLLPAATDAELEALLGVQDAAPGQPEEERDRPEALLWVGPPGAGPDPARFRPGPPPAAFAGRPNRLSEEPHPWPVIAEAHAAGRKTAPGAPCDAAPPPPWVADSGAGLALRTLIHQRRSAVAMDGRTGITRATFLQIVRRLLPARDAVPWSTLPWRPRVHLVLFVHRVQDVAPGLYLLARDPAAVESLRAALDPTFRWRTVEAGLPLFLLQEGDVRAVAQGLSCGQDIASDGVFAAAMLGELDEALRELGPWAWRWLHWEAGLVGQALYLEAEATGVRGTGIGCFFDEPTHELLLRPEARRRDALVDLYHFTMGGPVEDDRLQTLPPYHHREAALASVGGPAVE